MKTDEIKVVGDKFNEGKTEKVEIIDEIHVGLCKIDEAQFCVADLKTKVRIGSNATKAEAELWFDIIRKITH